MEGRWSTVRVVLVSAVLSVMVWGGATWPLPLYVGSGIPMSHAGGHEHPVRIMQPGDHLQLMYYHWLLADMLRGGTPWMMNPYEFHTGDEGARYQPDPYYVPFSLVYAGFAAVGGKAFGYNMAGLVSIWITCLFTWLWLRRYVDREVVAGAASLIVILLPYRWFALLGGSPTGFAMALTPVLLWGLDRAVREDDVWGGVWAGVAIVLSYTSDLHMFFFNTLLVPAWGLVAWVTRADFGWRSLRGYGRLVVAGLPLVVMLLGVVWYSKSGAVDLSETHMAEGRSLREVALFSPQPFGFLGWAEHPVASQIYLGYVLLGLVGAGMVAGVMRWLRSGKAFPWLLFGLTLAGVAGILLLATGPHGPRGGKAFVLAREFIPNYEMIRQAGKVFGILPPLLALLAAISWSALLPRAPGRRTVAAMVGVPLALLGWEYLRRSEPPICLLDREQPAYGAVRAHAEERGQDRPHILVVPLWPGDSHFASIYQFYASMYRLRMVNGYTPAIDQRYFEEIFLEYQTVNQGWFTEEQVDALRERGIEYVIVHEDLFPEKVSPFPVTFTLKMLLTHPRVELLHQHGPVWAFYLLPAGEDRAPPPEAVAEWTVFFPARYHELTRGIGRNDPRFIADVTADRGGAARLDDPELMVHVPPTGLPPAQGARWMVRARGAGVLRAEFVDVDRGEMFEVVEREVDAEGWRWVEFPLEVERFRNVQGRLSAREGMLDVDVALLMAGAWDPPHVGEAVRLPAALFFHAGHIDLEGGGVRFSQERDEARIVLYGPRLPFEAGRYRIGLEIESDAEPGTRLGTLFVKTGMSEEESVLEIRAGDPPQLGHEHPENLPLTVIFVFHREADVMLRGVEFLRAD
ncbi:MAG TPA: hypothetical protein PKE55_05065 [Kiritimatiellia bacterium]|nr:hypothetical protein [Kiritimatiellia bacterium]